MILTNNSMLAVVWCKKEKVTRKCMTVVFFVSQWYAGYGRIAR